MGGIYQLDKDTDASFLDGSDKEDDDTSMESDSSSVDCFNSSYKLCSSPGLSMTFLNVCSG